MTLAQKAIQTLTNAVKGRNSADTVAMNVGDMCVIIGLLATPSSPVSAPSPAGGNYRCAICGGEHDNDALSDICRHCEETAPWQQLVAEPSPAGGVREACAKIAERRSDELRALRDKHGADTPAGQLADHCADTAANIAREILALSSPATPEPVSAPAGEVGPFGAVMAEVRRATAKFPTWPTDPLHALAVFGEEFGELTKETLQLTYEPHKSTVEDFRKEAQQTAAMALRFLASLDNYQFTPGQQHQQEALSNPAPGHGEGGL